MMNRASKPSRTLQLLTVLAITALPFTALAEDTPNAKTILHATKSPLPSSAPHGFCTNLSGDEQKISSGLSDRSARLSADRSANAAKLKLARANVDAEVAADRSKSDSDRQSHFTALAAKATTPAQQQALTIFEQTVLQAVTTRRAAVDRARDTFRLAEDQAIASRQAQVNSALANFKAAVSVAESQAQASCAAGTSSDLVRATFVQATKLARTTYQAGITSIAKLDPTVKGLAQTRNAAIAAADASFKSSVAQAASALKIALKQK
jgi:hypothetical protein